jgi:hypothetical protein
MGELDVATAELCEEFFAVEENVSEFECGVFGAGECVGEKGIPVSGDTLCFVLDGV